MKIPSQFNEDSLYGRHKRRGATVQNYRRLIRLGLGLALVLVVMRQASKPRVYEPFFGGVSGQRQVVNDATRKVYATSLLTAATAQEAATEANILKSLSVNPQVALDARAIAALIPADDQQLWLATLLRIRRHREIPQFTVLDTGWTVKLSQLELQADRESQDGKPALSPPHAEWSDLIQRVSSDPSGVNLDQVDESGDGLKIQALIRALDAEAASRVATSGVWQSRDRDAMYRYLDEARFGFEGDPVGMVSSSENSDKQPLSGETRNGGEHAVPQVGVLPLMQQPDVYLNHVVAFAGHVVRVEKHVATSNEYEIPHYWHLWLRPIDGADRPLLAVVNEVDESIAALASGKSPAQEGPVLWITGRFLKRLAYRSSVGADSTAVIVGRILTLPEDVVAGSTPQSNSLDSDGRLPASSWGLITLAVLLGVGLAVFAMWRTAVSAKQSREIRHAKEHLAPTFLEQLPSQHADSSQPASGEDVKLPPPSESQ
ncbi:hypothetical protein SH528x_006131 [Novipirellula sp. SH528]|uniref:hypothetical protein n=1 Tax=Novipirellula sp. SH528 TaxID=3454466 RepID=UPI003F9FBD30